VADLALRVEAQASCLSRYLRARAGRTGLCRPPALKLFVKPDGGDAYAEFNLSPSQAWAAYDFVDYREGMAERMSPRDPVCTPPGQSVLIFDAAIPAAALRQCRGHTDLQR